MMNGVQIVTTPPATTGEGGLRRRGSEGGGGAGPPSLAGSRFFVFSLFRTLLLWGHLKAGERVAPELAEECWTGREASNIIYVFVQNAWHLSLCLVDG